MKHGHQKAKDLDKKIADDASKIAGKKKKKD